MNMYDKLVETLKSTFGDDPKKTLVNGSVTSSVMSAELVLIASLLVAALTIRLVSPALMVIVEVALIIIFMYATPIMPKLYKEHNDDVLCCFNISNNINSILLGGNIDEIFY